MSVYKKFSRFNPKELKVEELVDILKKLKVWSMKKPEKVRLNYAHDCCHEVNNSFRFLYFSLLHKDFNCGKFRSVRMILVKRVYLFLFHLLIYENMILRPHTSPVFSNSFAFYPLCEGNKDRLSSEYTRLNSKGNNGLAALE